MEIFNAESAKQQRAQRNISDFSWILCTFATLRQCFSELPTLEGKADLLQPKLRYTARKAKLFRLQRICPICNCYADEQPTHYIPLKLGNK